MKPGSEAPPADATVLERTKQLLRLNHGLFVVATSVIRELRRVRSLPTRSRAIDAYLGSHRVRKLQIGTGRNVLRGWLNTDLEPKRSEVVFLDVRKRFPFGDGVFDYVFAEHAIEHLTYQAGQRMLAECHRVLLPGGRLRIATLNLEVLTGLYAQDRGRLEERFVKFVVDSYLPQTGLYNACLAINSAFYNYGHRFLYDRATLKAAMQVVGFRDIRALSVGESDDEQLRGIESHGVLIGDHDLNRFETMVLEAAR
jgi:SAM-dependent methyltransferase